MPSYSGLNGSFLYWQPARSSSLLDLAFLPLVHNSSASSISSLVESLESDVKRLQISARPFKVLDVADQQLVERQTELGKLKTL
jgi:hypothetical protein